VSSREPGHFTSMMVSFLAAVGEGMGTLVENARLYQEISMQLEEGKQRLEAFQSAASRLSLEADPDQALEQLIDVSSSVVGAAYGAIAVWKDEASTPEVFTHGTLPSDASQPAMFDALEISRERGAVMRLDGAVADPDDPRASRVTSELGGVLCVPFWCHDGRSGVLGVCGATGSGGFTEADERHLGLFSALAGIVIDNIRLYGEEAQERNTLTAVQSSMSEGLVVLDPAGRVKYFNQAAEALLGIQSVPASEESFVEIVARQAENFTDDESRQRLVAMVTAADAPEPITVAFDKPEHVEVGVSRFLIPTGTGESMIGLILRDVTQEKEVERRRDTFVSVASHELRTPMTSILGFSELLKTRDPSPEVRQSWVSAIHEESLHVTSIVDDMLNVARIQSGRMHVEAEMLDVMEIASEVGKTIGGMSPDHTVEIVPAEGLAPAIGDRFKVAQVLTNLMENAIKYAPAGGEVTVRAEHDAKAGRIVVSVADTGMGIASEDSDRLFTTFHRIRRPETDKIKGTGLGLYIVKALVELMGGEVWLESHLNVGTTFYFSLPAKATELRMTA
ncbi:MAG: ATP-binding protein, partial [Dehalococcoidia bacterium]